VLTEIVTAFDQCRAAALVRNGDAEAPVVHLLIIATRRDGGDFRTGISRHLALAATASEHGKSHPGCRVIGVDLAGYEDRATRAHYFREDFTAVHRAGLAVTVHAGENDDAEAIWSAVFDLNARRIGHALHLIHSPALLDAVAARGIGIEMCPYANQQIVGFALDGKKPGPGSARDCYPLPEYLRRGIAVSVNTDNIGISGAGLTENLLLAARLCPGLRRLDLLQLIANGARTSFLPEPERHRLAAQLGQATVKTLLPR
jgi:adenosine deaminase